METLEFRLAQYALEDVVVLIAHHLDVRLVCAGLVVPDDALDDCSILLFAFEPTGFEEFFRFLPALEWTEYHFCLVLLLRKIGHDDPGGLHFLPFSGIGWCFPDTTGDDDRRSDHMSPPCVSGKSFDKLRKLML